MVFDTHPEFTEAKTIQIQLVNEYVDHPDRLLFIHVVVESLRKKETS